MTETRTEYRVVTRGGATLPAATLAGAWDIATFGLTEGESPLQVQSRSVTKTPWVDIEEGNDGG